ncbi:uncharacterized protein LOC106171697 [Lingula anatina]|uniref:Uncharacterized protein LOC106171697 n=1 Tax=Lingula anatina TaxID=7574 RepID=A0A1S3JBN2_LINAN|nr:uncharacterized protein LOC106171697 [Lingula anatina]|eukprot:XP_013407596.1 uncharacterized protein LOC106171697 [Lingula anatina]
MADTLRLGLYLSVTRCVLLVTLLSQRGRLSVTSANEELPCRILYLKGEKTTLSNFPWPLFGKFYYLDTAVYSTSPHTTVYRQSGRQNSAVTLLRDSKRGWVLEERSAGGLTNKLWTDSDILGNHYGHRWSFITSDRQTGFVSTRGRGFHCVSQALFGFSQVYIASLVFNGLPQGYKSLETCQQGCAANNLCWAVNWDFHYSQCFFLLTTMTRACKEVEMDSGYKLDGARDMAHYRRAGWCQDDFCLLDGATRVNCSHTCYSYPASGTVWGCQCDTGYSYCGQHSTCCDRDECANREDYCPPSQLCLNTAGRYYCLTCPSGYTVDGTRSKCVDVDECTLGAANCSQLCNNTEGGYHCSCQPGFTLREDNTSCTENNLTGESLPPSGAVLQTAVGVAAAVVLMVMIIIIVLLICRRRRQKATQERMTNFTYGELEHLTRPQPPGLSVRQDGKQNCSSQSTPQACNGPVLVSDQGEGHYSEVSTYYTEPVYAEPADVSDGTHGSSDAPVPIDKHMTHAYAVTDNINIPAQDDRYVDTAHDGEIHMVENEIYEAS